MIKIISLVNSQILIRPSSSAVNITTFTDMASISHQIALSNTNTQLVFLNSMTGSIVREVVTPSLVTHLHLSHSVLVSGSSDGNLRIHDPRTGIIKPNVESFVKAHKRGIQGIQATGNLIFTIGLGER
jgi:PAB-dependent poly(A)-specific ribonuclease subunit 2